MTGCAADSPASPTCTPTPRQPTPVTRRSRLAVECIGYDQPTPDEWRVLECQVVELPAALKFRREVRDRNTVAVGTRSILRRAPQ